MNFMVAFLRLGGFLTVAVRLIGYFNPFGAA
jgi:hypothetical protein